ncbi:LLM class flavin-dependent oxidoreductase [Paraburkholderia humisilvae]|nr:LLM class flavin-dependent oxidoreductase [Paraburkholderia humisilvae]
MKTSVLDFAAVRAGETARDALTHSVELARTAEARGFTRYWVAEHHGLQMFASAATPVVVGHIASKTSTIRIGSGGVMLPNHVPLIVAEQYGTLESLYPGRIDLGVGRASGTLSDDVVRALRLTPEARERFPDDLRELQLLFRSNPGDTTLAVPGSGLDVPIWVLASSPYSARESAVLGLPLAFATHIGPSACGAAIDAYRTAFRPSAVLKKPYLMLAVVVTAADTDTEAHHLFTSIQQMQLSHMRGSTQTRLPRPVADFGVHATLDEQQKVGARLQSAITGSARTVRTRMEELLAETAADEIMVLSFIHDLDARHRSLEIVAQVRDEINGQQARSSFY